MLKRCRILEITQKMLVKSVTSAQQIAVIDFAYNAAIDSF